MSSKLGNERVERAIEQCCVVAARQHVAQQFSRLLKLAMELRARRELSRAKPRAALAGMVPNAAYLCQDR